MTAIHNILTRYDVPLRAFFLVLGVVLGAAFILIGSKAALAMGLKENTVITGDVITLGDIFYNLPYQEDRVLGPAPRPGQEMTLNARTLMRIALALDLPWRPANAAEQIILTRAATIVKRAAIEAALTDALKTENIPGKFTVAIPAHYRDIVLPPEENPAVEVNDLRYDRNANVFHATLAAPSVKNPVRTLKISGTVTPLSRVPVLKENLRSGTVIGNRDIMMIDLPARELTAGMILDEANLIGMTPRRIVMAGNPVMDSDIESPRLIARGDMVTMIFRSGPMTLTARGKALEHGAKGDVIRVSNTASSRTVEAQVTGEREVTIGVLNR